MTPMTNHDDTFDSYTQLRQAHEQALLAAHGDSNDAEIEAWRDLAEQALTRLPGYQPPTIDD